MLKIKKVFLNWLTEKTITLLEKEQIERQPIRNVSFKELHQYIQENKDINKLIKKIIEFKTFYVLNFDNFIKDIINSITEEYFYIYKFENGDEISLTINDIVIEYPVNVKFLDKAQIIFLENYLQSIFNVDFIYNSIELITKEHLSATILSYDFLYYDEENDKFVIKVKLVKEKDYEKLSNLCNKINLTVNNSILSNIISK